MVIVGNALHKIQTKHSAGGWDVWFWVGHSGRGRGLFETASAAYVKSREHAPCKVEWVGIRRVGKLMRRIHAELRAETTNAPSGD